MLKSIFSKMSGRRRAVALVVVALVVLTSGTAMAITYTTSKRVSLKLNKPNYVGTALTKLASNTVGAAFTLETDSTAPSATPLRLQTETSSQAPLSVNPEAATATNLSADELDGKNSTEFQGSYKRTVVVSPVGTAAQNGTALLNALSGITASQSNPALLYIEPGTYDLGSGSLAMKQYVDIQGAGELNTLITSVQAGCTAGTVIGADNAELRFLTARNLSTGNCGIGVYNDSTSPLLTHVRAESTGAGGGDHFGVFIDDASPTMVNVTATASGGDNNMGVVNFSSSPTISHSRLSGSNSSLFHASGIAKVALTQLVGPVTGSGALQCFNNYDENLAAVTCP